jgi:penicillin-binding protein 1B
VAVVWVGRDDNQPTGLTGASGALTVWGSLLAGLEPEPVAPAPPEDIEQVWIDPASSLRADAHCTGAVELPFIAGSAPNEHAPCAAPASKARSWFERWFR